MDRLATRGLLAWAFASFAFNLGFSRFSYGVVLPALRGELAGSYAVYGVVNAINLGAYLVGTLVAPFLLRRRATQLRVYVVTTLVVGAGIAGGATVHDVTTLALWRALVGFASAIAIVATSVVTFERVLPATRGRASGAMWGGLAGGLALAGPFEPFVAGAGPLSWRVLWLGMAACAPLAAWGFARAAGGMAATGSDATPRSGGSFVLVDLVRPRRFLYLDLAYFATGAGYIAYATFVVALFRAHGIAPAGVAEAWTLIGIGGVAGTALAGRLVDSSHREVVLIAALVVATGGGAFALLPGTVPAFVSALLYGVGMVATPAVITAEIRVRTTGASYPAYYSAVTAAMCLGQFVGPIAAGPLVDRLGLSAAALFATVIYGAGIVFAIADAVLTRDAATPREETGAAAA
jgi:predicted MFS family arabinose efflux permease